MILRIPSGQTFWTLETAEQGEEEVSIQRCFTGSVGQASGT